MGGPRILILQTVVNKLKPGAILADQTCNVNVPCPFVSNKQFFCLVLAQ